MFNLDLNAVVSSTAAVFSDDIFSPALIFLVAGVVALLSIFILTSILHKR